MLLKSQQRMKLDPDSGMLDNHAVLVSNLKISMSSFGTLDTLSAIVVKILHISARCDHDSPDLLRGCQVSGER